MTPAQSQALSQARAILKAHFDVYVLSVQATDENLNDEVETVFTGPRVAVIGLARVQSVRLDHLALQGSDFSEFARPAGEERS